MKTIELESLQKKDKFEDFLREFYPSKVNCWSSLSSKELILLIEKFNQHSKETLPWKTIKKSYYFKKNNKR